MMPIRDAKTRMTKPDSGIDLFTDIIKLAERHDRLTVGLVNDEIPNHTSEAVAANLAKLTTRGFLRVSMAEVDGVRQRVWVKDSGNVIDHVHQTELLTKLKTLKGRA